MRMCVFVCENSLNRNNKHKQGNSAAFIRNTKCNESRATGDTTKFLITRAQLSKTEAGGELILKIFIITRRSTLPASQSHTHTHVRSLWTFVDAGPRPRPQAVSAQGPMCPDLCADLDPCPEPSRRCLKCTHMRSDQN